MNVTHPKGLPPAWWESAMADILVDLSKNISEQQSHAKENSNAALFERSRLAMDYNRLYIDLRMYLGQCVDEASSHHANALLSFEATTDNRIRVERLGHLSRTQTDLELLLRLTAAASEGSVRQLYNEMRSQAKQRKETVKELFDLPALNVHEQGWQTLSRSLRSLLRSARERWAFSQEGITPDRAEILTAGEDLLTQAYPEPLQTQR